MEDVSTDTAASVESADLADLMATLRQVHASGRTKSLDWRVAQLQGILRMCEEREPDIARALEADLGRDAFMSWFTDIASSIGEAKFALKHVKGWMKPRRAKVPMTMMPGSARVQYEPLGVVLIIGPWNYPFYLSISPLVAAVAAGNAVVIKPSELAPATSKLLAELVPAYLDSEAIKVVEGDGMVTQDLLAQGFDHALFTGGTEIGAKVMAGAAPTLTPVTLELGGKSPVIVAKDADLGVTARRVVQMKFMNSGQTCIAPDYVLVESAVKDAFVDALRTAISEQEHDRKGGLPIVNERQFERLAGYLKATKGEIAIGGTTYADDERKRIDPTVIVDADPDEPSMTDEIFGPILPIVAVEAIDDAIAFVNSRPKPLACYVFTKNTRLGNRIVGEVPAGGSVINQVAMHVLAPSLPFGGVGASGMGAYHGEWGFQTFSHRKAVLVQRQSPDLKLIYPPYGEKAQKMLRRLF